MVRGVLQHARQYRKPGMLHAATARDAYADLRLHLLHLTMSKTQEDIGSE